MSINLVEAVQTKMGYAPLHKVDPNTQEIIEDDMPVNSLAQAAVPAVLIELYKASNNTESAAYLLRVNSSSSWVGDLFGNDYQSIIEKVANYANVSLETASGEINRVTEVAMQVLRENVEEHDDGKSVKNFLNLQVANLIKYLPGDLQMGDALHDNTLDDRTHKMEGPFSNAMHAIERLFSDSDNQKKPFNPTDDTVSYH